MSYLPGKMGRLWKEGGLTIRIMFISVGVFMLLGYFLFYIGEKDSEFLKSMSSLSFIWAFITLVLLHTMSNNLVRQKTEEKIDKVEQRYEESPEKTQAAWDLARVKLEDYLNRNLEQVRSIFWLSVFVMLIGFGLIGFGISQVYGGSDNINASIVAAVSGILTNFIGVTFLVIYKATMIQAKDYVTVLERINAVGMAVQILETLDDKDQNKSKSTSEIAKQLLQMYSGSSTTGNA